MSNLSLAMIAADRPGVVAKDGLQIIIDELQSRLRQVSSELASCEADLKIKSEDLRLGFETKLSALQAETEQAGEALRASYNQRAIPLQAALTEIEASLAPLLRARAEMESTNV